MSTGSEEIGSAVIQAKVDATGVKTGIGEIKGAFAEVPKAAKDAATATNQAVGSIGDGAGETASKMSQAAKSFVTSLERQALAAGKTRSEYLALRAEQLGVTNQAAPFIAKMREAEQATGKAGMSAAAMTAALRGVPAQFTDIVTSLLGGQNALLVVTQQGGQLKDMFGGIGPAAKALGGYVMGLVSPLTVTAAAAAILTVALHSGAAEAGEFAKATVLTGNYVGRSTGQLADLAKQLSATTGTTGKAADVLAQLATSGKVAADSLAPVAEAALAMQRATGTAVDKTVAEFAQLGDEPVKASEKLNEQYHYLTAAVYEQIRALDDQGRKEEAAALAQKTYAAAALDRSNEILAGLGLLERSWNSVASMAARAWDAMKGLGRPIGLTELKAEIDSVSAELAKLEAGGGSFGDTGGGAATGTNRNKRLQDNLRARLAELTAQAAPLESQGALAAIQAENTRQEEAKIAAQKRLEAQAKATRSRAQQRKEEIEQLDRDAQLVNMKSEEYEKRVSAINERYKDPKVAKPKAISDDAATRYIQTLDQDNASALTRASLAEKASDAVEKQAKFEQLIVDLKEKKSLTADDRSLLAEQDIIREKLKEYVLNEKIADIQEKQVKSQREFANAAEGINRSIESSRQNRSEQYDRSLSVLGMGSQAQEQLNSQKAIYREYQSYQRQLASDAAKTGALGSEAYETERAKIKTQLDLALQDNEAYYAELRAKQGDWSLGAQQALADYAANSRNTYQQTASFATSAFSSIEDSLVRLSTGGKASFKDLANSILSDLIRIQARQSLGGIAQSLSGVLSAAFGGNAWQAAGVQASGAVTSGVAGGNVTGTALPALKSANGNVFQAPGLHAYANSIVDKPTLFPFAKGTGLMGEAGPEGIVPLTRMPSGRLGVDSRGGGGDVIVNNYAGVKVETQKQQRQDGGFDTVLLLHALEDGLSDRVASGEGGLARAFENRYGLR